MDKEALAQPQDHSEQHLNMVKGEPVAWRFKMDWSDVTAIKPRDADESLWQPLYTTPPSVEAAIEATKEKAAKVCEEYGNSVNNEWNKQLGVADDLVSIAEECAAAIRSMK